MAVSQVPINRRADMQHVRHSYSELLINNRKELTANISNKANVRKYYAERKKTHTSEYIAIVSLT